MTTKTDAARECAEELIAGIVTALRKTGNLVEGAEIEPAIKAAQNIIAKHFPPSVPVKRLEGALETARLRLSTTVPDIYNRRAELLVTDLEALIAEAK